MKRITAAIITTMLAFSSLFMLVPAPVFASSSDDACAGLSQLDSSQDCSSGDASGVVGGLASSVVNILSYIVGIAAVIMIIIGGFKYITSGGDSAKVSSAKTTITAALIGILVVVLAQAIVHFVLKSV